MLKKIFSLVTLLCLGILVTSCQANASTPAAPEASNPSDSAPAGQFGEPIDCGTVFSSGLDLMQARPPVPGDTIVTLHTNYGDVVIRFFPEEAPMAYENFVTHARNGFYDGVIFHRVLEGFMIQGGDPEGTGRGGESIWGHGFGPEFSMHLRHFRGALAMAHAGSGTEGSQFYIVHSPDALRFADASIMAAFDSAIEEPDEFLGEDIDGNRVYVRDLLSADMVESYLRYGGTPHLDLIFNQGGHTVFGQVIRGMDVVDTIAAVEVDSPQSGRPVSDVVIQRVSVTEY